MGLFYVRAHFPSESEYFKSESELMYPESENGNSIPCRMPKWLLSRGYSESVNSKGMHYVTFKAVEKIWKLFLSEIGDLFVGDQENLWPTFFTGNKHRKLVTFYNGQAEKLLTFSPLSAKGWFRWTRPLPIGQWTE